MGKRAATPSDNEDKRTKIKGKQSVAAESVPEEPESSKLVRAQLSSMIGHMKYNAEKSKNPEIKEAATTALDAHWISTIALCTFVFVWPTCHDQLL